MVRAPPVSRRKRSSSRSAKVARGRARRRAAASSTAKGRPSSRTTDIRDDLAGLPFGAEAGLDRPGAIDEELDGGRLGQACHRHQDFAGDAERLAARRDQSETGHRADQGLGQCGRPVDHVLTVVEDDDEGSPGQMVQDELDR